MSATERKVGTILDGLGVTLEMRDHDQLVDVLVIAKVIDMDDPDAPPGLAIGTDEAMDWIAARGLHESAGDILRGSPAERDSDD